MVQRLLGGSVARLGPALAVVNDLLVEVDVLDGGVQLGSFSLVAGTGFEPATSGL